MDLYNDDGTPKPLSELDDDTRACISDAGLKALGSGDMMAIVKYTKAYNKQPALEALGKHLGIFEKDNEQGKTSINIDMHKDLTDDEIKAEIQKRGLPLHIVIST